jgi:RNA polymerase sigma factor (sigma-70 family)
MSASSGDADVTAPHGEAAALAGLVARARAGDGTSLEELVSRIQGRIYGLSLRMLWHPEDARDATQEILIRVITGLAGFRGESAFPTWVYRVAANYLLSARRSRLEEQRLTFEAFARDLDTGLSDDLPAGAVSAEEVLLLEEVKVGCTLGMLSCLDRPHRLAYILGEILELDGPEAAGILEIDAPTYRKRLSRARKDIVAFMKAKCGLVNSGRPCRCRRRVRRAIELGRVDPGHLHFASDADRARRFAPVLAEIRRLTETRRAAALYRSHPDPVAPEDFAPKIRQRLARHP